MYSDEKRDVASWQHVGAHSKGVGPGSYSTTMTNAGARSQIGAVKKKKELADFFPK